VKLAVVAKIQLPPVGDFVEAQDEITQKASLKETMDRPGLSSGLSLAGPDLRRKLHLAEPIPG
jgi:hypothetical protein